MTVSLTINGVSYDYPQTGDLQWGPDATEWAQAVTSGMLQKAGGTFQLLADVNFGTTYGILSQCYKTRTANIASTGQFRLARADQIVWRNEANDADLVLEVNSSNQLLFNGESPGYIDAVSDTSTIDLTVTGSTLTADIVAGSITNSMISNSAAIAFSKLATLTSGNILVGSAGNVATSVALSGDATLAASGALTIANSAVTNAKLANMANITFKGNISGGLAAPSNLTAAQVTANLDAMVGASGVANGTKGLVPQPLIANELQFLRGDGSWATPAGAGDVVGPASSTDNGFAKFDGLTGTLLKDSAATLVNADIDAAAAIARSKLATGSNYRVVTNGAAGVMEDAAAITASRALVSDANGIPTHATTTATEIGFVNGVTSAIQTQLDGKQLRSVLTTKGDIYAATASNTTTRLAAGTNGFFLQANSGATEGLQYVTPQNSSDGLVNIGLTATVAANAMTISLTDASGSALSSTNPAFVSFGDSTITNGYFSVVSITAAQNIVIPSGATLGARNGQQAYIYVYLLNNAGTAELAVSRRLFDPNITRSSTAIDTASDSPSTIYSTTGRTNVRYRLIGIVESTQATAGTYATSPAQVGLQPIELKKPYMFINTCADAVTNGNTIIFTSVVNDSWSMYDTSTGIATIREKGIYSCSWYTQTGNIASGAIANFYACYLNQSGSFSVDVYGNRDAADASATRVFSSIGSASLRCDVGDTIKIIQSENIGAGNLDGNAGRNYFILCKVGGY
jgi:hypothetical protein